MKTWAVLFTLLASPVYGQVQMLPVTKLEKVNSEASFQRNDPSQPRWSPKSEHHRAAVVISCPSGRGSGVMIKHTGKGVIALTNRHVVRIGDIKGGPIHPIVELRSQNGNSFPMRVIATSVDLDLALLQSVDPEVWTNHALPLGNFEVPLGEDIELVGFGGPGNQLRHFYGERLAKVSINAITISGDSGSPLIYGGAVVGINYGGRDVIGRSGNWPLIYPASSFASGPILCQWVNDQCWNQLQCQPYIIQQPYQSPSTRPQGGYQMYPPSTPQVSPSVPRSPAPPPPIDPQSQPSSPNGPSTPSTQEKELIDSIAEKVLADPRFDPEKLRGEKGEKGDPGPKGPPGEDGQNANMNDLTAELNFFREKILAEVQGIIDNNKNEPINAEDIVNEVISRIPVCECEDRGNSDDVSLDEPKQPDSGKYLESNRVLYFTADSCTSCFETTNLVNSLKRSGYPITIITLTTSMAEAHQVPQIFVPSTGKRALGPSNVKAFLSQIEL